MGETFKKENEEKNSPKLTKEEYIKALEEKTAQIAQAKKSGNFSITETAVLYHDRGSLYMSIEDLDNAINDYQTAVTLTENEPDDDTRNYFRNALRRGCEEKQRTQTIDERMAPYAELIKEIKSRQMQPVYQITKYELREEYVELAAALAFFEEYELLKRYIKEGAGSINNTFNFNILNYNVRPQFAYWEPAPLYFITGKKAWNKMKDPKKMLEYLVKKGANIDEKAGDGSTPLLNLTFFDSSPEILDTLLELGANPDKTSIDNDIIWTPLTHCLMMKYEEEDANLPFDDEAIKKASLLLEYGADPNLASPDFSDFPPLVMALRFGFHTQDGPSRGKIACGIYDFIELLIKRGANINFKDSNGNTPLSIAQKNNLSAAVKLLLKNGALTPQQMDEQEENSTEKTAKNYFNEASGALKMKDYDKAVTLFFKAANTDFGNKEYHKAFANALLKRGLKPLQEKDKIKAEELYQKAVKARSLYSQEMWLQAALLGHLESAYELRNRFVIAVMTSPEGKALSDLLVKADHPQTLCKAAYNYSCGMGGYPRNKNKAMKLFQRAADLGYKPAADTIEQIKRSEKEEKERIIAEREFAKNNPPLKGKKREKLEEELKENLLSLSRKATFIKAEKCKTPLPMKQMLCSHIGGVPYFEKGGDWPCNENGDQMQFVFQVFQDSANSLALPKDVKLLQLFFDWEKEEGKIILYNELNTQNAVLIDYPHADDEDSDSEEDDYEYPENNLEYMSLSFETADMIQFAYDINKYSEQTAVLAYTIHPHKGERVIEQLCKTLGFKEPTEESYLGGFFCNLSNSWSPDMPDKDSSPLFQIYLESDNSGPFNWKRWDDAMIYATYNNITKKTFSILDINYD